MNENGGLFSVEIQHVVCKQIENVILVHIAVAFDWDLDPSDDAITPGCGRYRDDFLDFA